MNTVLDRVVPSRRRDRAHIHARLGIPPAPAAPWAIWLYRLAFLAIAVVSVARG